MDIMDLRTVITVICFVSFLGIFFWAYSGKQKKRFDEAANLPFADDEMQARTVGLNDCVGRATEANTAAIVQKEINHV